jgi:hypothetical protein
LPRSTYDGGLDTHQVTTKLQGSRVIARDYTGVIRVVAINELSRLEVHPYITMRPGGARLGHFLAGKSKNSPRVRP